MKHRIQVYSWYNQQDRQYGNYQILKTALLTPVLKKKTTLKYQETTWYRSNTVLSKIVETVVKNHIVPTLSATQNPLQRGFTEKTSPTNAAIIITEGIAEAKNNGKSIAIISFDAEKAFDKLVHDKGFCKL